MIFTDMRTRRSSSPRIPMPDRPENPNDLGERSRRYGIRDGAFQAVMQGSGENYLSAFALLLHASALQIGILSALPQLVGTFPQLLSVKILHRFRQPKSLILAGATGQTILWVPGRRLRRWF